MRLTPYLTSTIALFSVADAISIPTEAHALIVRNAEAVSGFVHEHVSSLEKRKGGGGKGGGGGGSSGGKSSKGGGKSGKSGGGSSSSSSSRTSSTSNTGGATRSGSGVKPSFGGGKYYSGGAATPYKSGARSPLGVAPFFLGGAALGFYGGYWAYGAWAYPYHNPYHFINRTDTNSTNPDGTNTTLPVNCLCGDYQVCGCDDNTDQAFLDGIIGNGTLSAINSTVARVTDVNGTKTIVLNGTLANGTTASGGQDDAAGALRAPYQLGMWALSGAIGAAVMML